MSDHEEERQVKAMHDVTQYYQRRSFKRTMSRQQLPRRNMIVSGDPYPGNSNSSLDDDVEDDTYMPSPRDCPHEKGLVSTSGNGAVRGEEIEEECDGADEEEEDETFVVDEINPSSYVHMGTPIF
jgi:hypothetical protein